PWLLGAPHPWHPDPGLTSGRDRIDPPADISAVDDCRQLSLADGIDPPRPDTWRRIQSHRDIIESLQSLGLLPRRERGSRDSPLEAFQYWSRTPNPKGSPQSTPITKGIQDKQSPLAAAPA
ncbi:MAG: hypothetical protein ACK55I_09030, partial [bacterium]